MWGRFDQLGKAFEQVRNNLDQVVDTALGIDGSDPSKISEASSSTGGGNHNSDPTISKKENSRAEEVECETAVSSLRGSTKTLDDTERSNNDGSVKTSIHVDPKTGACLLDVGFDGQDPNFQMNVLSGNPKAVDQQIYLADYQANSSHNLLDDKTLSSAHGKLIKCQEKIKQQAEEILQLQAVQHKLQEKNKQLVLSAASVSESDLEAVRKECELQTQAAERKVYALTKERDALKKGMEKVSVLNDLLKEKEKDHEEMVEEGEALSRKQHELETALRKRKVQVTELEASHTNLKAELETALSSIEHLKREKHELVNNLEAIEEQQRGHLQNERKQFESLLLDAQRAQAEAEEASRQVAKEGLTKQIEEGNSKISALVESNTGLRLTLDSLRAETAENEATLKKEITALQRQCEEAEARREEVAEKFPLTTQPLIRQIEALQSDALARSDAWTIAESSLLEQLESAETQAEIALERERMAVRKLQNLEGQSSSLEFSVEQLTQQLKDSNSKANEALLKAADLGAQIQSLQDELQNQKHLLEEQKKKSDEVHRGLQEKLSSERHQRMELEKLVQETEAACDKKILEIKSTVQENPSVGTFHEDAVVEMELEDSSLQDSTISNVDELTRLKQLLKSREREVGRMSRQIESLEATQERFASQLVTEAQRLAKAEVALLDVREIERKYAELQHRYQSCVELLGEKDERLSELEADLRDIKEMYKDQISYLAEELQKTTRAA